jgi:hypothetical protein
MDAGQNCGVNVVEDAAEQRARQRENSIVIVLARPPRELIPTQRFVRRLRHPAFGMVVGVVVVAVDVVCLLILIFGNQNLFQGVARSVIVLPMLLWLGSLFFFPLEYMRESVSALVQSAARGDSRLAPPAHPQPTPLDPDDAPAVGQTIGPIVPLRSVEVAQVVEWAGLALYFVAGLTLIFGSLLVVLSGVFLVSATSKGEAILGGGLIGAVAVFLLGMGVWCIWAVRKGGRLARTRDRSFQITLQPEGVSWESYDKTGLHEEYLAWRDADALCVAEYRATAGDTGHQLYVLQVGETRLAWESTSRASAAERKASLLLVRLAAAKTGLPLRDLMPAIRAFDGAVLAITLWNWNRTRAQRPPVEDQLDIPGVPVEAIRAWNRTYAGLFIASGVLSLVIEVYLLFGK